MNIKFLGYFVREITFQKNDNFKPQKINADMKFSKNCTYLDNNRVRLNIKVNIFEDAVTKNYPFSLNLIVSGLFQYTDVDIEEINQRNMLEQKAMETLYPYIRTIVSTITMASNLPPLLLPTINVKHLIKNDQAN